MDIELISSCEELPEGGEVTFEIVGLEPHAEGGTYIVRWIIDPPGSLQPARNAIMHGKDIYSIFSAVETIGADRVAFEVRTAERPVTVQVDVRYRRDSFPPVQAREMHAAGARRGTAGWPSSGHRGAGTGNGDH